MRQKLRERTCGEPRHFDMNHPDMKSVPDNEKVDKLPILGYIVAFYTSSTRYLPRTTDRPRQKHNSGEKVD